MPTETETCKGCTASVRLAAGEVQRLLAGYLLDHPHARIVDDPTYARRLSACRGCEDLKYGTTCRHCGCVVEVRAKLADKTCPSPTPKWQEPPGD